ncbi:hypothetical protein ABL78_0694 [Leptomonas seymouri]|uniref:PNPLA domain-containing protein n=1 Tax=Leptomonas seymouri TaxID=5684 RepID=A0A0N0P8P1_LEPSE|nr:hypothetical protein ABL78_0694 [Leptomonas seymouri]|eukprot:KPI90176.1 hypothetical protein ABL78_0694 [Leptomonas seymouri]
MLVSLVQSLLFHGLAMLQYVYDFPLRVQFRRTTQRFLSVMNTTESYATFVDAAASLDHYCGVAQWAQEAPPLDKCDAVGLLVDAVATQQLIKTNDVAGMEIFLLSLLKRNAHGLMDPSIYNFFACPKYCVEDYTKSVEALIVAYAAASGSECSSPPYGKVVSSNAGSPTSPHKLRACWVRMDALHSKISVDKASRYLFPQWGLPTATATASKAGVESPQSSSSVLPAVDITMKIQRMWRCTSSAPARPVAPRHTSPPYSHIKVPRLHSTSLRLSDTGGYTCSPQHHSEACTAAAALESTAYAGGALGGDLCVPRQFPGSSSEGENGSCLREVRLPTPPTISARGSPVAVAETECRKRTGGGRSQRSPTPSSPVLPITVTENGATRSAERNGVNNTFTFDRSPSPSHNEDALLAHIDSSCAALHRLLDDSVPSPSCLLLRSPRQCPSVQRRIDVLRKTLRSFGRTAFVLSGGSSMGTYHAGVARALYEAKVLPDILCGSSAGSIFAALICTKTAAELHSFMQSDVLSTEAMQVSPFGEDASLAEKLRRFFKTGFLMDVRTLMECVRGQCGDLTFLEAYKLSGKVLNVSVTRSQQEGTCADRHALLNYVSAPDVVIWSAVSASCALPGLFTAVQLVEKPPSAPGTFSPYLPGELWCDGSIAQDIPRRLLTQLFGVDYFIVSQVNPYVIPFLKPPPSHLVVSNSPSLLLTWYFALVALWGWVLTVLFSLRLLPRTGAFETFFLAFAQEYGGDVTIYPVESLLKAAPDYLNLVNNPSAEYISYVASRAQCRTWPLVTRIRLTTAIERCLLHELQRLQSTEYAESRKHCNLR